MTERDNLRLILEEDMKVNFGRVLGPGGRLKEPLFKFLYLLRHLYALYTKKDKSFKDRIEFGIYKKLFSFYSRRFCLDISYKTSIGKGLRLPHPMGIVIHGKASLGDYCTIMQQVTIGNRSEKSKNDLPVIESNVYIGAGAKILGSCTLGTGCVIGANAVVIHDIPEHSVAAGVPARIISRGATRRD